MTERVDHVNAQVTDAAHDATVATAEGSTAFAEAAARELVAHSIGLAMQNAVAHQQRMDVIRGAIVSAAATELMENRDPASLELMRELLSSLETEDSVAQTLGALSTTLAESLAKFATPGKVPG